MMTIDSPIGPIRLEAGEKGLRRIELAKGGARGGGANAHERAAAAALERYFAGDPAAFDGLALDLPTDLTDFRRRIYDALRAIPFGETCSYAGLAAAAGRPGAARAVGTAMAQNPLPIVQPCHRVLTSSGSIGGYSPDLSIKRRLLAHEAKHA